MVETSYKSNRNVFYACHYNVVWCQKYRRKVLVPPLDERLKQIIREVCEEHQAEIEELEVMPDHVHHARECRSPIWHSSPDEAPERPFVSFFAPGISCGETKIADFVDELVFCQYDRGAPLSEGKQYIERQKHV